MYKLALSQIVKNEEHVILRQLESISSIVDALVIVDTGSTDNTKSVITQWANEKNIPLYLYDRPFDNFEDSRNYALDKVKEVAEYAFWLDADEIMHIDHNLFNKNKLDKDIYMFETSIHGIKYTRNECWRTASDIRWEGHIHEYLTSKSNITSDVMKGIKVEVRTDGGSWQGDISKKYKDHAVVLENYVNNINNEPRWLFYTAQSWLDSAVTNSKEENDERLKRARYYFQKRVDDLTGYHEERFYAQYKIGVINYQLEEPFEKVYNDMMKAYEMDPTRIEPLLFIIEHYKRYNRAHTSYMYSTIAMELLFNKSPFPNRVLHVDERSYIGIICDLHFSNCIQTNRIAEGINTIKKTIVANYQKINTEPNKDLILAEVQRLYSIYQNICINYKVIPESLNDILGFSNTNTSQISVKKGSNITAPKKKR